MMHVLLSFLYDIEHKMGVHVCMFLVVQVASLFEQAVPSCLVTDFELFVGFGVQTYGPA
jgi:hypothetical protein